MIPRSLIALASAGLAAHLTTIHAEEGNVAQELKVAAVQMRSSPELTDNLVRITNSIRECARNGARVVVFPECALTGMSENTVASLSAAQLEQAERQMADACREAAVYAIVGTAWRDGRLGHGLGQPEKPYNSALIIAPTGKVIERYHKIQLAESWPQPGDHLSVFKIDDIPCSVIICHDERYPELVRLPVLAGAKIIFYISHESGLREENKINPYRAQIQARAVENTVFVIQANAPANDDTTGSHGQSRIIAPDGNILREASIFKEEVVTATLELRKATRHNALNSLTRCPLRDWWKQGLQFVRIIE